MRNWTHEERLEAHRLARTKPELLIPHPTIAWPIPGDPGYVHPEQINRLTLSDVPPGYRYLRVPSDELALQLYKAELWLWKERADYSLRLTREVPAAFWRGFRRGAAVAAGVLLFAWQIIAAVDFGAAW